MELDWVTTASGIDGGPGDWETDWRMAAFCGDASVAGDEYDIREERGRRRSQVRKEDDRSWKETDCGAGLISVGDR